MKRFLALAVATLIVYYVAVLAVHAQNDSDRLRDADSAMRHQIDVNTERLNSDERRLSELDAMQIERRITTLENTVTTSFRLLIFLGGAMVTLLLDAARRWFAKPPLGCNIPVCPLHQHEKSEA